MMSSARMKRFGLFTVVAAVLGAFAVCATAQSSASNPGNFELHSKTFSNQGVLPLSTILNNQVNGVNTCTANGAAGGDQSPDLAWTNAPRGTESYVVVLYDVTAAFTHWGMYNIRAGVTQLPAGAGVAGSGYGPQIENDFALG